MSNYTKTTNFATKDNLSPGNPLKIVKGTEIDTEYNNIATAVATKTDNSAAAITGGTITGITDLAVADGGTGASTAANARTNLGVAASGANSDITSLTGLTTPLTVLQGGTGVTTSTGTTNVVLSNSPTLVTPALGTPSAAVLTNATGLPISTGVSGLGTGVATFLGTPSSANLASAVTDETGSGALVFANSPTLVTPALGTPSALVGTNITGTASGLTAGNVTTNANLTGAVTSVGNATSLGSFSSANLLSALTDETGTGVVVFATNPVLVTPNLGTPSAAVLTSATGLPLSSGVTGQLPVANGGTGTATPSIVAGTNVTVTGTWPNQTIAASGSGGGVAYTAVKTANYTAANNDGVLTNTTGGAFTVTLPSTPSVGNIVLVIDSLSQWGTNNLTVDPTGSIKIAGNTAGDTLVCDITGATVTLVYTGATYGWNVAAQVGGNGGTAVTLTGTQTLTNKTLTAPTISSANLTTALTLTSASGNSGDVLTSAGSGNAPTWVTPSGGGFANFTVLTSGTSYTVPSGITKIKVTATGGGGAGANVSANTARAGGGGGAGGSSIKIFTVVAGNSYTYAIGAGGTVAAGTDGTGNTGGDTTFTVGATTITGSGGAGGAGQTAGNYFGGLGGAASSGDMNISGGGGGAGRNTTTSSGIGGSSYWGGGGAAITNQSSNGNGNNGEAYGSGGSGAAQNSSPGDRTGGVGAQGVIVIEY